MLKVQGSTGKLTMKIKKGVKTAKEDWIEQHCTDIEESLSRCKTKRAYQTTKQLITSKRGQVNASKDEYRKCLTEEQKIFKCWTEYWSEVYTHKMEGNPALLNCPQSTNDTTYQWNLWSVPWQPSAIWYGRQENGQYHGLCPWSSNSSRMATCNYARIIEQSALLAIPAKLWWRYYATDLSHRWKRSLLGNKLGSEQEGAPLNKSSTFRSCVRNICTTNNTSTISS